MTNAGPRTVGAILRAHLERLKAEGYEFRPPPADGPAELRCERCGKVLAELADLVLAFHAGAGWSIECLDHGSEYYVPGRELFAGGFDTADWLAQIAEKRWFEPAPFFGCIIRLRRQRTGFYLRPANPAGGTAA